VAFYPALVRSSFNFHDQIDGFEAMTKQPSRSGDAMQDLPAVEDQPASQTLNSRTMTDTEYLNKLGYKQELNRALGLFSSFGVQFTSISVGSVVLTTMIVGFAFFGPAAFWSFLIGGALQVFLVGLAVGELVSAFPLSGGVYQIINRLTGKTWLAWQGGWWLVIAHTVAVTAVAVAVVPFVAGWLGFSNLSTGQTTIWALAIMVVVTVVNIAGVKIAAIFNNMGVFAEIGGILLVIAGLVFAHYQRAPMTTLMDTAGTVHGGLWIGPFLFSMLVPAFTISSFDATGNAAEETKDAARTAPMGTFLANTAAYVTGVIFILLLVLAIPNVSVMMASSTPVDYILRTSVGPVVTTIFETCAMVALFANMCMVQLTGVRVMWSKARDGQMPGAHWLRKVNKHRIPINATLVCGVLSGLFALWSSLLSVLAAMTALAWALAYGVVVACALKAVLQKKLPEHPWSLGRFSFPVFLGATLWSIILCTLLAWSNPISVGLGMVITIIIGFGIYFTIPKSRRGKTVVID